MWRSIIQVANKSDQIIVLWTLFDVLSAALSLSLSDSHTLLLETEECVAFPEDFSAQMKCWPDDEAGMWNQIGRFFPTQTSSYQTSLWKSLVPIFRYSFIIYVRIGHWCRKNCGLINTGKTKTLLPWLHDNIDNVITFDLYYKLWHRWNQ